MAALWSFTTTEEVAWAHLVKLIQSSDLDINAQDWQGDTFLHHLTDRHAITLLHQLGEHGLLARIDPFVVNAKGQTPLQLAQRLAVDVRGHPVNCNETRQAVFLLTSAWRRDVRPLLKHLVEAHLALIHDLAELVLEFVDGGGSAPARA